MHQTILLIVSGSMALVSVAIAVWVFLLRKRKGEQVTTGVLATLRRFPLPLTAFAAAGFLSTGLHYNSLRFIFPYDAEGVLNLTESRLSTLAGFIALAAGFWFFAVKVWQESEDRPRFLSLGIAALGFAFVAWRLYEDPLLWPYLIACTVLLAMTAPFLQRRDDDLSFWHFNRAVWSAAAISILAATLLYAYLAVAAPLLYAAIVDRPVAPGEGISYALFYNIPDKGIAIAIAVTAWSALVLSAVPRGFRSKALGTQHGMARFAVIAVTVLATLTLTGLYIYLGWIVWPGALPYGGVAAPVAIGSAFSVAAYLAVYPFRKEIKAARLYTRFAFPALLPLVMFLGIAIAVRIGDYGVTEPRYFGALFAVWLFGCAAGVLLLRPALKLLPLSLAMLLLAASFGPWGASSVSTASQLGILQSLVEQSGMLTGGKIDKAAAKSVPLHDRARIYSIVGYFTNSGKTRHLLTWLDTRGIAYMPPPSADLSEWQPFQGDIASMMGWTRPFDYLLKPHQASFYEKIRGRPSRYGFNRVTELTCRQTCSQTGAPADVTLENSVLTVRLRDGTFLTFELMPLGTLRSVSCILPPEFFQPGYTETQIIDVMRDGQHARLFVYGWDFSRKDNWVVIDSLDATLLLEPTETN